MQLDRFTQKAQEAIVAAQAAAARLDSPVLDAEHLLDALVEPDDGIPAETLRRLGVDLPAFRGELAAALARRARIKGGSLALDPRAKQVIELAEAEARRLGDDYVSTEHLLIGAAEIGGEAQALLERHGAGKEAILGAFDHPLGPRVQADLAALDPGPLSEQAGQLVPEAGQVDAQPAEGLGRHAVIGFDQGGQDVLRIENRAVQRGRRVLGGDDGLLGLLGKSIKLHGAAR